MKELLERGDWLTSVGNPDRAKASDSEIKELNISLHWYYFRNHPLETKNTLLFIGWKSSPKLHIPYIPWLPRNPYFFCLFFFFFNLGTCTAKATDLLENELVSTELHFTISCHSRNKTWWCFAADTTLNIKHQPTRFAGLPAQDKQFCYHKFLFWPVQAGVWSTHASFPHCFPQHSKSRWEVLRVSICKEDMTLFLHPWGSSQPGVKWLFVTPLPINREQGAVLHVT